MELIFTKGAGKFDRLVLRRPGFADQAIDCPKQRIIPHDMVHFAVESVLEARGFLRRAAAGERADFNMAAESESDGVERLVETVQGDAWSGGSTAPDEVLALYGVTCDARGCPPLPVDMAAIEAIRTRVAELTCDWEAVPIGGTMTMRLAC
ncbi:hypothetical protein MZO42_17285 [Sphingomonas psychrotolerans]|uniref:Uncharacterized protein n=1 Tax=Sphingomonas psychrotolerans TaxID=1327635 RepID=A0ABU3N9H6_9SPHN|nr:hypothetical protein [Sphingomonas psychrotolerans]MDT8760457.1 hypothetical protein [Sphingomonas psychrotolerans]